MKKLVDYHASCVILFADGHNKGREIMKIHGQEAIEAKEQDNNVVLNHYTTALEEGAENITLELAEEIADEDPGLVWCEV